MYQRIDSRQREPRRTNWTENLVVSFRGQNGEVYFHPADEAAMKAFFSNLKGIDEGEFRNIVSQAPTGSFNGGSPVAILTVDDLRSALKPGETLFTGFENDGEPRNCGLCGAEFQLHKRSSFQRDDGAVTLIGGDIAIVKKGVLQQFVARLREEHAAKMAQYDSNLAKWQAEQPATATTAKFLDLSATPKPTLPADPAEMINRLAAAVEATMTEFVGDGKPPELTVALPVGFTCGCQKRVFATYVAGESVLVALAYVDKKVGSSADRNETERMLETLGSRRPQRHAVGSGPSDGRRYDRNRGDRPEKPRTDWHGASLEEATAQKLTEAGYANLADALKAVESGELLAKGIAHAGSIGAITFALKRAGESRQVMGDARGAAAYEVPGAGRPKTAARGGKKREFTAPAAPRGSNRGVGLSDLRG